MAGRYPGSYLDRSNGWRAVSTLAEIGQASLVGRIPYIVYDFVCMAATGLLMRVSRKPGPASQMSSANFRHSVAASPLPAVVYFLMVLAFDAESRYKVLAT